MRRGWWGAGVVALFLLLSSSPCAADDHRGYGPWRLGMSKADVAGIEQYGPYEDVKVTGGLETFNGIFEERRTNISFVFGPTGLSKIQIRAYEGQDLETALETWYRVLAYLVRIHGAIESRDLPLTADVSRSDFAATVRRALDDKPKTGITRLQMAPAMRPPDVSVFSSLFRHPQYGYYVFLYYQEP